MTRSLFALACVAAAATSANAFAPSHFGAQRAQFPCSPLNAVTDIGNEVEFDETVNGAGDALVVVDYSTTWCGPCKVIAPTFEALSDKYSDVIFLKVIGDVSPPASQLMKREGVRSVPSFHYFKSGSKVDVVNGANAEAIEAAIKKYV